MFRKHEATPGEQPCRRAISTKLLCNFIEIITTHRCAPQNLQKQSSRGVLSEDSVLCVGCKFSGAHPCVATKSYYLQLLKEIYSRVKLGQFFHSSCFILGFTLTNFFQNQHNFSQAIYLLAVYLNMINLESKDLAVKQNQFLRMFLMKCTNQDLGV